MMDDRISVQEFELEPESELRIEVEGKDEIVTLELTNGLAEIFGTELVKKKKYEFTGGAKFAVFTWQGCTIKLFGTPESSIYNYVAKETPMRTYLNSHVILEEKRKQAVGTNSRGPVVMVVGPRDVGKSTLCRLLLNYAVRVDRKPIYVDLDVEQGHIAIPGTVGALLIEKEAHVADGFSRQASLVFHYGRKTLKIPDLYNHVVTSLAEICSKRLKINEKAKASGIVINTCGWTKEDGHSVLIHAAEAFRVDTILVLDNERLRMDLLKDGPKNTEVVMLRKSGGVVERNATQRTEACEQRIREYFYGSRMPLYPHSFDVKFTDVSIFKLGAPMLPSSCMPVGMRPEDNWKKLVPVALGPNLLHHVLAVSFAKSLEDDIAQTNVIGFVCVTNVDVKHQTFTVLSPQPGPLPKQILLLSEIQFMDTH